MKGHLEQDFFDDTVEPNEIWNRRITHVHYKALPLASKAIEGLPEIQTKHEGVCKAYVRKERTQRRHFQVARARKKEYWKSSTPMYVVRCHPVH